MESTQNFEIELSQQGRFSDLQWYLISISKSNTILSEIYLDERRAQSERGKVGFIN